MSFFNETTQLILRILVIIGFFSPLLIRFGWWRKPGLNKQSVLYSLGYSLVEVVFLVLLNLNTIVLQYNKTKEISNVFYPNSSMPVGEAVGYTLFALLLYYLCRFTLRLGYKKVEDDDETVLADKWWNRFWLRTLVIFGFMVLLVLLADVVMAVLLRQG